MIIFEHVQRLSRCFGYQFTYSDSRRYIAYNYLCYAINYTLSLAFAAYIAKNINDVVEMTELMSLCMAGPNAMFKGFIFIINRQRIKRLLNMLQHNVDDNIRMGRIESYQSVEKMVRVWSITYVVGVTVACLVLSAGPILTVIHHKIQGDFIPDMLILPVKLYFPFDEFATPMYQVIYACILISSLMCSYLMIIVNGTFMGCTSQLMACQSDLHTRLDEINMIFGRSMEISVARIHNCRVQRHVKKQLLACVRFHMRIISWTNLLARIYSPIIFVQLFVTIIQLCALAFQIQMVDNIPPDRLIAMIITVIIVLNELLMYCYFGNAYTHEAQLTADAAYNAPWYCSDPAFRSYYRMIIRQAQRPRFFVGFKLVNCSLENFKSILNTVVSMVALLRSVAE